MENNRHIKTYKAILHLHLNVQPPGTESYKCRSIVCSISDSNSMDI